MQVAKWGNGLACAALIFVLASLQVRADAILPDSWKISLFPRLAAVVRPLCVAEDPDVDPAKWDVYKTSLDRTHTLYLVQCFFPASNDVHFALIGNKAGAIVPARLYHGHAKVWNVRFASDHKDMIDISGSSASCSSTNIWRWHGNHFILRRHAVQGCK